MKYIAEVKKIGDSLWVLVPLAIKKLAKIKEGDFAVIDLEKYQRDDNGELSVDNLVENNPEVKLEVGEK